MITEGMLTWIVGGLSAGFLGAIAYIMRAVGGISERVRDIELQGIRGSNDLERKISDALSSIREALIRIEARLQHLESASDDERGHRGVGSGR